jgi:hypothetical protein
VTKKSENLLLTAVLSLLVLGLFDFSVRFLLTQPQFYIFIFCLVVSAFVSWKFPDLIKKLLPFALPIIVVLSFASVFAIHYPSLQAKWGVIDDHEIMVYLGQDGKMDLSEWPALFLSSEISRPGETQRFRPVYSGLRYLETALWDNNPQYWYATRLIIFSLFVSSVWYFSRKYVGHIGGGILAAFIVTSDYWRDIVARLGPSEIYVALGLAGIFFLLPKILATKQSGVIWALFASTYIIAVGAKENMVLLGLPLVVLFVYLWKQKLFTSAGILASAVMFAWTVFVTWAIASAMLSVGSDVYGQATTSSSRLSVAILSLKTHQVKEMAIGIFFTSGFLALTYYKGRKLRLTRPILIALGCMIAAVGMFMTQFIFYNGNWPDHNRYDFPGLLYLPLYWIAVLLLLRHVIMRMYPSRTQLVTGMTWAVYLGVICLISMRGLVGTQVKIAENVAHTQSHTARIEQLATKLVASPESHVVFESSNVWDYEPIHSYTIFLRAFGVRNPLYLKIHEYSADNVAPGLEITLAEELTTRSENGGNDILPLSDLDTENCFSILLSGSPSPLCTPI